MANERCFKQLRRHEFHSYLRAMSLRFSFGVRVQVPVDPWGFNFVESDGFVSALLDEPCVRPYGRSGGCTERSRGHPSCRRMSGKPDTLLGDGRLFRRPSAANEPKSACCVKNPLISVASKSPSASGGNSRICSAVFSTLTVERCCMPT